MCAVLLFPYRLCGQNQLYNARLILAEKVPAIKTGFSLSSPVSMTDGYQKNRFSNIDIRGLFDGRGYLAGLSNSRGLGSVMRASMTVQGEMVFAGNNSSLYRDDFCGGYGFESVPYDFSALQQELDTASLELIGSKYGFPIIDLAYLRNRWIYGLCLGGGDKEKNEKEAKKDTIARKFNGTRINLYTGYALVNSKHFFLAPKVGIQWVRYRLLTRFYERKIPLEQYVNSHSLDLRFTQFTANAGLNLAFKFRTPDQPDIPYVIGFTGGYQVGLMKNPIIRSQGNRLTTNNHIDFNGFYFNLFFGIGLGRNS